MKINSKKKEEGHGKVNMKMVIRDVIMTCNVVMMFQKLIHEGNLSNEAKNCPFSLPPSLISFPQIGRAHV